MTSRDRSIGPRRPDDFRTLQLAESLIHVAEAMQAGFSVGTPFVSILRTVQDLFWLLKDLLAEGIPQNPSAFDLKINEWGPDKLFSIRDDRMNVTSTRIPVPNPLIGEFPNIIKWIDSVLLTSSMLIANPAAEPKISSGQAAERTNRKLSSKEYNYFRRQRASRKNRH